jgi:hypothetical protein
VGRCHSAWAIDRNIFGQFAEIEANLAGISVNSAAGD